MQRHAWRMWGAAGLSAGLLELPFPLAGPMPAWRSLFAWIGLAPLLWAVLGSAAPARPFRRAFLLAYLSGFLWYMGNCYWVRDTMSRYGDMPSFAPTLLLVGFSLVLGLYFGLFGLGLMLVRRGTGSVKMALAAAPFLWTALELAAARITSVPWDQLGYSQVDNALITRLAPWTGVYGISFLLVAVNALLAGALLPQEWGTDNKGIRKQETRESRSPARGLAGPRPWMAAVGLIAIGFWAVGLRTQSTHPPVAATAVLVQPNLDVAAENNWLAPGEWEGHVADFMRLAGEQCKSYIAGIPQTGAPTGQIVCPPYPTYADMVVWPEAPAPFFQAEPRFKDTVAAIARRYHTSMVVGGVGNEYANDEQRWDDFNSAMLFDSNGQGIGRYDKIHLVPFGEFVPFEKLLFFAKKLTGRVGRFDRGIDRSAFRVAEQDGTTHRYGIFICYEAVFADEVRHFAANGAEVLVNISDDGWYGDTSAPWQHLNMARMRAIENRRWLLRDTNNGVTAVIDPDGRVRQSIPRHQADALPAQYGFRSDVTFYTAHGDVFAWCCAILSLGAAAWALNSVQRAAVDANDQIKVRS